MRGLLTAGGYPVHRVTRAHVREEGKQKTDEVPVMERYHDLAAAMHRTAIAPRQDRFIVGCVCGWATLTESQATQAKATIVAQQHVIDQAETLFNKLEAKPLEAEEVA